MTGVAVVAGAGGAGTAVATSLVAQGYHVVILDHHLESAEAAMTVALANGGTAEAHGIDLLDSDAVVALRDELLVRLGRVDALIHLVGGWRGSKTLDVSSVENWNTLHPRVVGTLATLTAVFGNDIRSAPAGRVVMVTSTAAARPTAGNIAYAAAKRAAEAWMEGTADFLRGSSAAAVIIAVKSLLTVQMAADDPERQWPGYTHVDALATAVTTICTGAAENGLHLDLTAGAQG